MLPILGGVYLMGDTPTPSSKPFLAPMVYVGFIEIRSIRQIVASARSGDWVFAPLLLVVAVPAVAGSCAAAGTWRWAAVNNGGSGFNLPTAGCVPASTAGCT